ncbi:MAG: hypothetical protein WBN31_03045 [Gammaproteobacteria bacterium]
MDLFWQKSLWQQFERSLESKRLAHGILLEGPAGLGKTQFARRMATRLLDLTPAQAGPGETGPEEIGTGQMDTDDPGATHPDLVTVEVPEDKKQIGVDQIRALCLGLSMTSHGGGYKVAIINPADKMNVHAANSLLKTLEEPTPNTVLILVRSRLDTLPATIASRCQRVRFAIPDQRQSLDWLQQLEPDRDWALLLNAAGGAPLAALLAARNGEDELEKQFAADLHAIAAGRKDPVATAAEWNRNGIGISLRWLNAAVCELIKKRIAPESSDKSADTIYLQNIDETIPLGRLFCYLDEVQSVLARRDGALNSQMMLESLLVPWAGRLEAMQSGVGF